MDLLLDCRYTKPVSQITLKDKPLIIQMVSLHSAILCTLGELNDFKLGF